MPNEEINLKMDRNGFAALSVHIALTAQMAINSGIVSQFRDEIKAIESGDFDNSNEKHVKALSAMAKAFSGGAHVMKIAMSGTALIAHGLLAGEIGRAAAAITDGAKGGKDIGTVLSGLDGLTESGKTDQFGCPDAADIPDDVLDASKTTLDDLFKSFEDGLDTGKEGSD